MKKLLADYFNVDEYVILDVMEDNSELGAHQFVIYFRTARATERLGLSELLAFIYSKAND